MHELLGPEGRFGHREHLHLAWRALQAHDRDAAVADVEAGIRCIAAAHGAPGKYHRTLTESWVSLVAHHLDEAPELPFDEFLDRFPPLLDRHLLASHYSPALLASAAARESWVTPDLRPLPGRG